jgi:type VI secretion system secreted protein Hcp
MKFKKVFFAIVVLGAALVLSGHYGWAALPAYMELEGENQGVIEGSCDRPGFEGTIVVYSFGHNVVIPRDPTSGLPTGHRTHNPLKILKEIDKSSPKLYQALCTGEHLPRVTLRFYRIDNTGHEEHYFTIFLEHAVIVSITPSFPAAFLSQNEAYRHMETVAFTYEKIKWTWEADGIESEDSWVVPKQ